MSDSDQNGKKSGVPSWQLHADHADSKRVDHSASESESRQTTIEQAEKFIEEDEVRNASTDKKIAFLESKGLQPEEIQKLLGVARNPEATATPSEPSSPSIEPQKTPSPMTQPPSQPRDTPPIITYPEFLTTPQHPTPLVTKARLLTTLYLFGGLSALLYGTNTYLIEPMLASLTTSRLSLAETASSNLQKLITKLESIVSEIPPSNSAIGSGKKEVNDAEDSDEDPTEMFHRDIGVQTSLPTSPDKSRPESPKPEQTHLSDQTSRLNRLALSITGLVEDSANEGQETSDLSTVISLLRDYLDDLAYVSPSYGYGSGYGGTLAGSGSMKGEDDEIGRVKASIRGVKGVLLSARSFPGGGGRVR